MPKIRIMGVDPGTQITGLGIIDVFDRDRIGLCHYECIRTDKRKTLPERLKTIYTGLTDAIDQFHPDQLAVEDIFYSENVRTAIVLGHARGVSLLAPVIHNIEVSEYSPREVKLAVVGNGAASKKQVQFMVQKILRIQNEIKPSDAADALAVAVCHFHRLKAELTHTVRRNA